MVFIFLVLILVSNLCASILDHLAQETTQNLIFPIYFVLTLSLWSKLSQIILRGGQKEVFHGH